MYTTPYHHQSKGYMPSMQGEGRGKMSAHSDIQFIKCLQKFPHQRTEQVIIMGNSLIIFLVGSRACILLFLYGA